MTRLSSLLLQPPVDPEAPALAQHYAASAVAIAEHALQVRLAGGPMLRFNGMSVFCACTGAVLKTNLCRVSNTLLPMLRQCYRSSSVVDLLPL